MEGRAGSGRGGMGWEVESVFSVRGGSVRGWTGRLDHLLWSVDGGIGGLAGHVRTGFKG